MMDTRKTTIFYAVKYLASVNQDRCSVRNNIGFNARDTSWGNAIAQKPIEFWSDRMFDLAQRMIKKYRAQILRETGIDIAFLYEEQQPQLEEARNEQD